MSSVDAPPGRDCSHLDNACLSTSIYLAQCSNRMGDIVADNICNAILNIRLNNTCYGSRTNSIAVSNLGMGKSFTVFFIQLKQNLAPFQNGLQVFLLRIVF